MFFQDPRHSALGVHGKTGVTSVTQHSSYLYTTGRDGNFRKYQIHQSEIVLVDKQKVCKGLDWIEGIWFDNNDVVVYGFYLVNIIDSKVNSPLRKYLSSLDSLDV